MHALYCPVCRGRFPDDGVRLACPTGCESLLQSVYRHPHAPLDETRSGVGRYHRRLPGDARATTTALPVVIGLPWLAARFPQLEPCVVFSGWWPKHGAFMRSGSFKDLEAAAVLARLKQARSAKILVLASAGNTAAAFADACGTGGQRCIIIVAEDALPRIRLRVPCAENVTIVALSGGAAYDDAIALSRALVDGASFVLEGGVRNVARRDGMGIALGVALEHDRRMPDYYAQAVGSAAGALAVHETAQRARAGGVIGALPRLFLSQNAPFLPLVESYGRRSPVLLRRDEATWRLAARSIAAQVLTNMAPPYALPGGIYDALRMSEGDVTTVGNGAAFAMFEEFAAREGVELDPAAAVTLASLAALGAPSRSRVLVHLTGGKTLGADALPDIGARASLRIDLAEARSADGIERLRRRLR